MRLPARFIASNLVWSRRGPVWAVFRVEPATYPWQPRHDKLQLHHRTRAALLSLPGEAMVLSLCVPLAPGELGAALTGGCSRRAWATAAAQAGATVAPLEPNRRVTFLAAALGDPARGGFAPVMGAARACVAESFGLTPPPVGRAEIAVRAVQARNLLRLLSPFLDIRAATVGEVCWAYAASVRRGSAAPIPCPIPGPMRGPMPGKDHGSSGPDTPAQGPRLLAIADAVFTEGGAATRRGPRFRRHLRVDTEGATAFQALLAVSDMPRHFRHPDGGGEWLVAAERAGFPVDWCVRVRPVDNRVAQASARRQARQLQSQVGEYDGDPAGAPPGLGDAMDALHDLRAQLAANPNDSELQITTIFAVACDSPAGLEERVGALRTLYATADYQLHRPIGGQLGLFTAMLPGSPPASPTRDYTHHLLGRDLAAAVPFGGTGLGDPWGMLLGYSLDAGTFRPVLFDPAYGPGINRSGSLGAFGALGSGKSYFIKNVVHATLARGGRVIVLDRTASGEYARLADVAPVGAGRARVISLDGRAPVCLDPMRVFSGDEAIHASLGFLTLATGTSPGDPPGIALAEAVEAVVARPAGRLADVVTELAARAGQDRHAEEAWRALKSICRHPLARVAFGNGDPALLDADYLVFHAPGLSLPDREVALREHLARHLLPEQVLSQALLYLVAAVARQITFSDKERFAAALFDEAWCLTSSLQGRALLLDGVRDGRKHNAAVWLLSQHPSDLGDDQLVHLLGPRFVFRQAAAAAPAALRFVGVDPSEAAVSFLTSAPEGACLFRDVLDRVGRVQVLPALSPELHLAFDTNPEASPAGQEAPPAGQEAPPAGQEAWPSAGSRLA